MLVNFFHTLNNQYMVFRLSINAQLACKRRPFEVLLTPFGEPIKHLLKCLNLSG